MRLCRVNPEFEVLYIRNKSRFRRCKQQPRRNVGLIQKCLQPMSFTVRFQTAQHGLSTVSDWFGGDRNSFVAKSLKHTARVDVGLTQFKCFCLFRCFTFKHHNHATWLFDEPSSAPGRQLSTWLNHQARGSA